MSNQGAPLPPAENTAMFRHSPECDTSRNVSLRSRYHFMPSENVSQSALFIAAAIVIPEKDGDRIIDNGLDLGRDAFVARATLNNTNGPIANYGNPYSPSTYNIFL